MLTWLGKPHKARERHLCALTSPLRPCGAEIPNTLGAIIVGVFYDTVTKILAWTVSRQLYDSAFHRGTVPDHGVKP